MWYWCRPWWPWHKWSPWRSAGAWLADGTPVGHPYWLRACSRCPAFAVKDMITVTVEKTDPGEDV